MKAFVKNSVVFLTCVVLVGCQAKKANIVTELYPEEQKKLESIVQDIFLTAKNKDLARLDAFHLHSPKFTKFEESDISHAAISKKQGKPKTISSRQQVILSTRFKNSRPTSLAT